MPFERPTLTELVDRITADIESRVTGGQSLLRRSVLKVLAKVYAGAVHLLYSYLGYQSEQIFASTADTEFLERIADEYGVNRSAAVKATGNADITGTNGVTVPADTELQTSDGVVYLVDSAVTIAAGVGTLALTAKSAGDDGNQDASTTLSFVSPIVGVNTEATVDSSGITGGEEEETDEELRERILTRKQFPPYGGCQHDYEQWMLEYSGVTRVWVFPSYSGAGTVGCAFVMDDSTSYIPSSATMALVRAYLVEHTDPATGRTVGIPITAEPGLEMITLAELEVDFELSIYPNTSAIQNSIELEMAELIKREGGPNETLYLSDIAVALSSVQDLERFTITSPSSNTSADYGEIHAVGTITFSDY